MMDKIRTTKLSNKKITLIVDNNPYEVTLYTPHKAITGKIIIFPIFNYQKDAQYVDLITPLVDRGYKLITVSLLNHGDKVLFFNYYFTVFQQLLEILYTKKYFQKEELTIMGMGIGGYLASYMNFYHNDQIKINKIVLISPVNRYKGEYTISKSIHNFLTPTYIFYGQLDRVNDVNTRYSMFKNGKQNPNVHFFSYPVSGHYLYYSPELSRDLSNIYIKSGFDLLVGETRKDKIPFLPSEVKFNEVFFRHLFNIIDNRRNRQKIALLTDVFPLFTNGVGTVTELLKQEFDKLGYETYIIALWKKDTDYQLLPSPYHIPVVATFAKGIKGYKDLMMLKTFNVKQNAKMLAMFGFDYLHLHTEYSMSWIALELAKITGIKMPYTYHTLWKLYYEFKFGKLVGDITYKTAKSAIFNRVYKECPTIIVPSQKSYEILNGESNGKKDIRIIPSAIDASNFVLDKEDKPVIRQLKIKYNVEDKKILGYVGRISTEKNIKETIYFVSRVVKEIPNIVFMVVGVGDAIDKLQKYAKKLNIEKHVVFTGRIPYPDLKYYYAMFDAFVTASNFETQGLTYFEAATMGCTIIAKEDQALEGVFKDGENCYIYNDFYQWVERLEKALFGDNKKIKESAKNTMKKFAQDKWAKQILKIYIDLNNK